MSGAQLLIQLKVYLRCYVCARFSHPSSLDLMSTIQFFRADTDKFRDVVSEWMDLGIVSEWQGNFATDDTAANAANEFFGLPSEPPFYVGNDGMQSIPKRLLSRISPDVLTVSSGTRVSGMERDENTQLWRLYGTDGNAAFHDTPEQEAKQSQDKLLGEGYCAIILTDVSSSFGGWHRASAGIPDSFADRVRQRVGARVPLFSAMVAFERSLRVDFDAMSFHKSDTLWFAARMRSKPGMEAASNADCWTLVSTPEYAMDQITETPMQDSKTGEFIPQSSNYLTTVPAPDLLRAFQKALSEKVDEFPKVTYLNAQRWGSAVPCHRHLNDESRTRQVISDVAYDSGRAALAPTSRRNDADFDFLVDEGPMLFQAGDMVSRFTPGFESAALSGIEAAEHLITLLEPKRQTVED